MALKSNLGETIIFVFIIVVIVIVEGEPSSTADVLGGSGVVVGSRGGHRDRGR